MSVLPAAGDGARAASAAAATQPPEMFQPGDIIFEDSAYVAVINDEERGKRCDFCFRCPEKSLVGPLGACAKCKFVHYCSKDCQKGDWPFHKTECKRILSLPENLREKLANAMVRLMARIVDRDARGENVSVKSAVYKRCFDDLEPHVEEMRQQPERMQRLNIITEALKYFLRVPDPLVLVKYDDAFFLHVFGRIAVNSYGVTDDLGSSDIGTAIYLDASRLDHSCKPNAVTSFHGTSAHIRALEPIPKSFLDLGPKKNLSRIRTTYSVVDLLQLASTKKRKEKLKKKYLFDCDCQWCNEDDLSFLGRCPECEGLVQPGGSAGFMPCEQCGYRLGDDEKTLVKQIVVESLIEHEKIARLMEREEYKDCLDRCHALMLKQDQVFFYANRLSLKTIIKIFTCAYTVLPISLTEDDPVDIDRRLEHLIEMMANYGQLLTRTLAHPLLSSLKTFFTEFYLATAASQQKMGLHSEAIDTLDDLLEAVNRGRGERSAFATLVRAYKSECEAKRSAQEGNRDAGLEIITNALKEMSKVFSRQHPQWKRMQELQYELEMPDLLTGGHHHHHLAHAGEEDTSSLSNDGDHPSLEIPNDLAKPPSAQSSVPLRKILEGIPSKLSEAEISSSDDFLDEKPVQRRRGKKGKPLPLPATVRLRSNDECESITSEGSEVRISSYEAEKSKLRNKKKKKKERRQSGDLLLKKEEMREAAPSGGEKASNEEKTKEEKAAIMDPVTDIPSRSCPVQDETVSSESIEVISSSSNAGDSEKAGEMQKEAEEKSNEKITAVTTEKTTVTTTVLTTVTPSDHMESKAKNVVKKTENKTEKNPQTERVHSQSASHKAVEIPAKEKPIVPIKPTPLPPGAKQMSWARIVAKAVPTSAQTPTLAAAVSTSSSAPNPPATGTSAPTTTTKVSSTIVDASTAQSAAVTPAKTNQATASPPKAPTDLIETGTNSQTPSPQTKGVEKPSQPDLRKNASSQVDTKTKDIDVQATASVRKDQVKSEISPKEKTANERSTPKGKDKIENQGKKIDKTKQNENRKSKTPRARTKQNQNAEVKPQKSGKDSTENLTRDDKEKKEVEKEEEKKGEEPKQTQQEMDARMADLLVKRSDSEDSNLTDKEKAGVAWRILQFCLASRTKGVKVQQDIHIAQPHGSAKSKTLQENFVARLSEEEGGGEKSSEIREEEAKIKEHHLIEPTNLETTETPVDSEGRDSQPETQSATEKTTETSGKSERSKAEKSTRSRTPSLSKDKKNKKKQKGKKSVDDSTEDIDELIAEIMKMDEEKAEAERLAKSKEEESNESKGGSDVRADRAQRDDDYKAVKTNYDKMFEEFERDIFMSMEEMQRMGVTSDRMEARLDAIQNHSADQSQRFRAVKESYKSLGLDLERRLRSIVQRRRSSPESSAETGVADKEKRVEDSISFLPSNEPKSPAEAEQNESPLVESEVEDLRSAERTDEGDTDLIDTVDAEMTDKGYTLTDDGISDDVETYKGGVVTHPTSLAPPNAAWGDLLEEADKGEVTDRFPESRPTASRQDSAPETVGAAVCCSEDSGLSDSKTSEPYNPYKGKKKRKQRPRVRSMIEIS